jgi:ECM component-binding autotransporter adhesin
MNFKRNILGSAVFAAVASFSMSTISDEIPAPDAFDDVDETALAATEAALDGKQEWKNVDDAREAVTLTAQALDSALGAQANKNKAITAAQSAITEANALTAGQLIGGKTKSEIVGTQNNILGLTSTGALTGTGLLSEIGALDTAVVTATKNSEAATAVLAAVETGVISNQLSSAAGYKAAAAEQDATNGTVASGSSAKTLGKILYTAQDKLGKAAVTGVSAAEGLYLAVEQANAEVVTAKNLITGSVKGTDNFSTADDSVQSTTTGIESFSKFNIANGNVLDIRDGDTQLAFTVGATTSNDEAALVAAINAEEGFSFTASGNGSGAITLTYNDAATAIQEYDDWTPAKKAAREAKVKKGGVEQSLSTSGTGRTYEAQNLISYDVNVANKELLASEAAAALQVGISSEILAQENYDAGVETRAAHLEAETAAYKAAATAYTKVDSVLQEQLAQQNVRVAGYEADAVSKESAAAEDLADVTSTAAALQAATEVETAAAADVAAARAAYTATGGATTENLAALNKTTTAKTAATAAKTTAATAATEATNVYYGSGKTAATAISAQTGTNKAAVAARTQVVTSQKVADGLSAQRTLQVQIAADATNPAGILQAALVAGEDTGGAVVVAANTNYQATQVNAAGISANVATLAVHEGLVTQNIADIATNTTNIATNTTNIATNTTNIATNTTNIASNTSSIAGLTSSLADSTANLQRVELQMNENVDMLKSGIASALAVAGMPTAPGEGMGFSIGTGYFDGESAVAMGLTFVEGNRSFKVSFGHSGSETSASAGAAFKF